MGVSTPCLLSSEDMAGLGLNGESWEGGGLGSRLAGYSWGGHVPLLALFHLRAPCGSLFLRGSYQWGPGEGLSWLGEGQRMTAAVWGCST